MKILLNNNQESIDREHLTVAGLLQYKNYTFKMLVVKINGQLVPKTGYKEAEIRDGDDVHVIHLISGG
jgi:thiamine biosynthesis protein ThiS